MHDENEVIQELLECMTFRGVNSYKDVSWKGVTNDFLTGKNFLQNNNNQS